MILLPQGLTQYDSSWLALFAIIFATVYIVLTLISPDKA